MRRIRVVSPNRMRIRRVWYWVWAECGDGNHAIYGPFDSNDEAYQDGYNKSNGQFEVAALSTSNRQRATEILKARYLQQPGIKMDEALKRVRHK